MSRTLLDSSALSSIDLNPGRVRIPLARRKLLDKVTICDVGCTSQHRQCEKDQASAIVYGPSPELGGTWYIASPDDVEEIITEHVVNGRVVDRLRNSQRSVKFT